MLNYVVPCLNYVAERYMKYSKKRGIPPGESGSGGEWSQAWEQREALGTGTWRQMEGHTHIGHLGLGAQWPFCEKNKAPCQTNNISMT